MTLPIQLHDYKQAVKEAGEVSVKNKHLIIYLYRKGQAFYSSKTK